MPRCSSWWYTGTGIRAALARYTPVEPARSSNRCHRSALILLAGLACAFAVNAQSYPSKPVRIIVPFSAGGGSDIIGRIIANKLTEQMRQQVFVENRVGAGGTIGIELAIRSAPDGYSLVLASASEIAVNPVVYTRLTYDSARDLAPIALVGVSPLVVMVHPSLPVKGVKDLIALAKARPGDIHMASAGNGTFTHLAGELFKSFTGANMTHVPYKGGGAAIVALLGGEAQVYFGALPSALPHLKTGRTRVIAVADKKRAEVLPRVPTVIEAGVADYEAIQWWGMFVTAATPVEIVGQLHNETARALRAQDIVAHLATQGVMPGALSRQRFGDFVRAEVAKWGKVARASGVKLD